MSRVVHELVTCDNCLHEVISTPQKPAPKVMVYVHLPVGSTGTVYRAKEMDICRKCAIAAEILDDDAGVTTRAIWGVDEPGFFKRIVTGLRSAVRHVPWLRVRAIGSGGLMDTPTKGERSTIGAGWK